METLEWNSPVNEMAVRQFELVAEKLSLDRNITDRLRRPDRAMVVVSPRVWMTEGSMSSPATGFSITMS